MILKCEDVCEYLKKNVRKCFEFNNSDQVNSQKACDASKEFKRKNIIQTE